MSDRNTRPVDPRKITLAQSILRGSMPEPRKVEPKQPRKS